MISSSFQNIVVEGYNAIELSFNDDKLNSSIIVCPDFGANLLRFSYNGKIIIDYKSQELKKRGFTGSPILFPTPNRVYNGDVIYNSRVYPQIKNGRLIKCHGIVFDEPFEVCEIKKLEDKVYINLVLDIDEEKDFFKSFPFRCSLHIFYILDAEGLTVKYTLENKSEAVLQYGFGIHPYFKFNVGDKVLLPSKELLELEEMLPTGKILKTEEHFSGLNTKGSDIEMLTVDNDFLRDDGASAFIKGDSVNIEITPSEQFRHFVVYKNKGDDFICIEPQSCSINAHKLSFEGFEKANILNLKPKSTDEGYIKIKIGKC